MFDVKPTEEQKQYAQNLIKQYNFGMRQYGNGDDKMQYVGMLSQTVLADLLNSPRPNRRNWF